MVRKITRRRHTTLAATAASVALFGITGVGQVVAQESAPGAGAGVGAVTTDTQVLEPTARVTDVVDTSAATTPAADAPVTDAPTADANTTVENTDKSEDTAKDDTVSTALTLFKGVSDLLAARGGTDLGAEIGVDENTISAFDDEARTLRNRASEVFAKTLIDADKVIDTPMGSDPASYMHQLRPIAIDGVRADGSKIDKALYAQPRALSPLMAQPRVAEGAPTTPRATWQIDLAQLDDTHKARAADGSYIILLELPSGVDARSVLIMRGETSIPVGISSLTNTTVISFRAGAEDVVTVSADIPEGVNFETTLNAGVIPAATDTPRLSDGGGTPPKSTAATSPATTTPATNGSQPGNGGLDAMVPGSLDQAQVATLLASLGLTVDDQGRVVRVGSDKPLNWGNIAIGTPGSAPNASRDQMLQLMLAQLLSGQGKFTPVQSTTDLYLLQILMMLSQQNGGNGLWGGGNNGNNGGNNNTGNNGNNGGNNNGNNNGGNTTAQGPVTVTVTPAPTTTSETKTSETTTSKTTTSESSKSSSTTSTSPTKLADILNDEDARQKLLMTVLMGMLTGNMSSISTGDPTIDALIRSMGPMLNGRGGARSTTSTTSSSSTSTTTSSSATSEPTPTSHSTGDTGGTGNTGGTGGTGGGTGGSTGGTGTGTGGGTGGTGSPYGEDASYYEDSDDAAYVSDPYADTQADPYADPYGDPYADSADPNAQPAPEEVATEYNEAADAFLPVTGISPFVWLMLAGAGLSLALTAVFVTMARRENETTEA